MKYITSLVEFLSRLVICGSFVLLFWWKSMDFFKQSQTPGKTVLVIDIYWLNLYLQLLIKLIKYPNQFVKYMAIIFQRKNITALKAWATIRYSNISVGWINLSCLWNQI